jgi:hypothetical protein
MAPRVENLDAKAKFIQAHTCKQFCPPEYAAQFNKEFPAERFRRWFETPQGEAEMEVEVNRFLSSVKAKRCIDGFLNCVPKMLHDKYLSTFTVETVQEVMKKGGAEGVAKEVQRFVNAEFCKTPNPLEFAKQQGITLYREDPENEPLNVGKAKDLLGRIDNWLEGRACDKSSMERLRGHLGRIAYHCHNDFHSRIVYQLGTIKTLMPLYDYLANLSRQSDELCDDEDQDLLFECKALLLRGMAELLVNQTNTLDILGDRGVGAAMYSTWLIERARESKHKTYRCLLLRTLSKIIYESNDVLPFDGLPKMLVDNFIPDKITVVLPWKIPDSEMLFKHRIYPCFQFIEKALMIYMSTPSTRQAMIDLGFASKLEAVEQWISKIDRLAPEINEYQKEGLKEHIELMRGLLDLNPKFLASMTRLRSKGTLPLQAELREPAVMKCYACSTPSSESLRLKRCARCEKAWYCSAECQKAHWKAHKKECDAHKKK